MEQDGDKTVEHFLNENYLICKEFVLNIIVWGLICDNSINLNNDLGPPDQVESNQILSSYGLMFLCSDICAQVIFKPRMCVTFER